jgi:hypothetical protein
MDGVQLMAEEIPEIPVHLMSVGAGLRRKSRKKTVPLQALMFAS